MSESLNDKQILTLMQFSPDLDKIASSLPHDLQDALLDLEKRSSATYMSGKWINVGDPSQTHTNTSALPTPTVEEAKYTLGKAYLALDEQKKSLQEIMDKMELTPSFLAKKNWLERAVDNIQGWFR